MTQTIQNGQVYSQYRVGVAFHDKKKSRYLNEQFYEAAKQCHVKIIELNSSQDLYTKGPFHCIIHKIQKGQDDLKKFQYQHPETLIIDPIDQVEKVQNRQTMLKFLQQKSFGFKDYFGNQECLVKVTSPHQVIIPKNKSYEQIKQILADNKLKYPLVAKSMVGDGREGSHCVIVMLESTSMKLLVAQQGLGDTYRQVQMKLPFVVQQYVEHGGLLYKVFVLGNKVIHISRRKSLCLTGNEKVTAQDGYVDIEGISRYTKKFKNSFKESKTNLSPSGSINGKIYRGNSSSSMGGQSSNFNSYNNVISNDGQASPQDPPFQLVQKLVLIISQQTGLSMFNIDLLCPINKRKFSQHSTDSQKGYKEVEFTIVDINYFPGFQKVPNFSSQFFDYIKQRCQGVERSLASMTALHLVLTILQLFIARYSTLFKILQWKYGSNRVLARPSLARNRRHRIRTQIKFGGQVQPFPQLTKQMSSQDAEQTLQVSNDSVESQIKQEKQQSIQEIQIQKQQNFEDLCTHLQQPEEERTPEDKKDILKAMNEIHNLSIEEGRQQSQLPFGRCNSDSLGGYKSAFSDWKYQQRQNSGHLPGTKYPQSYPPQNGLTAEFLNGSTAQDHMMFSSDTDNLEKVDLQERKEDGLGKLQQQNGPYADTLLSGKQKKDIFAEDEEEGSSSDPSSDQCERQQSYKSYFSGDAVFRKSHIILNLEE